jgi:hypothetical protein
MKFPPSLFLPVLTHSNLLSKAFACGIRGYATFVALATDVLHEANITDENITYSFF